MKKKQGPMSSQRFENQVWPPKPAGDMLFEIIILQPHRHGMVTDVAKPKVMS